MDSLLILLLNTVFLVLLFVILLVLSLGRKKSPKGKTSVKEDIKKIKQQIEN